MKTGVEKIIQAKGGDAPAKNQTGVQKIIELLGGDPPAKNQTGVDKIVEILENGGGGGNPNRVETIVGTLANPFGDMTKAQIDELCEALPYHGDDENADTATGFINFDGTALGAGFGFGYFWRNGNASFVTDGLSGDSDDMTGFLSRWTLNAENNYELDFASLYAIASGVGTVTDVIPYASLIPTTLTIIWHPLPDQS